jgi:hypothetical protein
LFGSFLAVLSQDDRRCPALIWLRDGEVASVNRANFKVGLNAKLQSWRLQQSREIQVSKELQSPNSFLSLNLMEGSAKQ